MRTTIQFPLPLNFNQILQIVRRLPDKEKIRLTKELEKEAIYSRLSHLLKSFKTNKLSESEILNECNNVRERLYTKRHD